MSLRGFSTDVLKKADSGDDKVYGIKGKGRLVWLLPAQVDHQHQK